VGAYATSEKLRIGYFDRSYDLANHQYGYTIATETGFGTQTFATAQATTVLSDPTQNDRWFSGGRRIPVSLAQGAQLGSQRVKKEQGKRSI